VQYAKDPYYYYYYPLISACGTYIEWRWNSGFLPQYSPLPFCPLTYSNQCKGLVASKVVSTVIHGTEQSHGYRTQEEVGGKE
jgi:hypothetical protein